ncbi:MAG: hypothetical protein GY909_18235 [Oligoflexia bacterium]|nr:hypothetical protein [Oligoflexia bacterium]
MKKIILLTLLTLTTSLFANNADKYFDVHHIRKTTDKNFNGIFRGMGVFQDILTRDYGAANSKGLIRIKGKFTTEDLIVLLFKSIDVKTRWDDQSVSTILDRGYINDGSEFPRIPEKLQKVVDLYNTQIMGLVRGSENYQLLVFSVDGRQNQGWLIYNKETSEALYAYSYE